MTVTSYGKCEETKRQGSSVGTRKEMKGVKENVRIDKNPDFLQKIPWLKQ